ncbi:MAG: right-handed parallel beta-helix repeat-containing protein [Muribaculaceae bacterium]|nr:right-handed parallel beta-helix repeat-containing protein [Muribaculaceae bacterium]
MILEEKGTLAEVTLKMPALLKAYAQAYLHTEEKETAETALQELEVPVSWECDEDYDNTELESYRFLPGWDEAAYAYEADDIPVITVSFEEEQKKVGDGIIDTQEELEAALLAGESEITLAADISLTSTLTVPMSANTVLDGNGFSLKRGTGEDGAFLGTMLSLGGEDYTKEHYGTLMLRDICVDGQTSGNRAGAPAIIDHGSLILGEGAFIKNNKNYGTYRYDADGKVEVIVSDFGGGIQVYGELRVTENALVTGNFADEFGGGVYLADGALLYLYADVIQENSVAEGSGYGADLYASNGSTIYYDSSIDIERDGFYFCREAILICMQEQMEDSEGEPELMQLESTTDNELDRHDDKVEIYISAAEESGYSDEFLEALTNKLESAYGYSVIPKRAQVDTTDLRDWYVYDHYDTAEGCWGSEKVPDSEIPQNWFNVYGNNPRRKYYSCTETYYSQHTGEAVYTIAEWLDREDYLYLGVKSLAQFREHIYNPAGSTDMTFVGYGDPAYVDFMYYNPQSNGEKVVNYDIDSTNVISHALAGTGFLVNAGVEAGRLYGYLIFYYYGSSSTTPGANPTNLYIYKLDGVDDEEGGIDVEQLHGGTWDLKSALGKLGTIELQSAYGSNFFEKWDKEMSVQIKVSPKKIEIWQKPKDGTTDFSGEESRYLSVDVEDSGYNGFGPLVAYTTSGHNCARASSFTYSNLHMYYTNPTQGNENMLQPLEMADYTQEGTQKYFLNLFGTSDKDYNNEGVETGLYQEYLKLMQVEGVALITDRETLFAPYLGKSGVAGSNLYEMKNEGLLDVNELAAAIAAYIGQQSTTYLQHKLQSDENEEGLTNADPKQAVGNIWLKSAADGGQVRTLSEDSLTGGGYRIEIIDDIAYYYESKDGYKVKYEIIKPNGSVYLIEMSASDSAVPSFLVGEDASQWSGGRYTVRQTIIGSSYESTVHGYAYFDLKRTADTGHTHVWSEYTIEQDVDCITEGYKTRYCLTCGATEREVIPANGHSMKDEWCINPIEHWHECAVCNTKMDSDFHEFGEWETDEDATETKDGARHRSCIVCGYSETESIKRGKITKREECGKNAPQTVISMRLPALALAALEEEDMHAVGNGVDIEIVLTVEDADNTVSDADKVAVASKIASYKSGQYFDVNLYKEMNADRIQIRETDDKIRLTIEVPKKFRKSNTQTPRKFAIIRVHNGNAVILQDMDSDDSTITIDTDRFSTYALVYADRQVENYPEQVVDDDTDIHPIQMKVVSQSQKDSEPRTGQPMHFELYATIAFIEGASYLMLLFAGRHGMTEEKKNELVARIIGWAKQGRKLRRIPALAALVLLLVYYHSIGKQVRMEWLQIYEE